ISSSSKAAADWTGGAYGGVREHGQAARTLLAAFFNTPQEGMPWKGRRPSKTNDWTKPAWSGWRPMWKTV
ncbi:hypothetical protein, partial [uncultured Nitrospira sp.]|uniref:hypothetical protein n=1 Tax=uncultured Nitrospira sp. TaxID=157176 RepID=UPI00313FFC52